MKKIEFPIFQRKINKHPLVYLDSASTTQKPRIVIEAISDFYQNHNANIQRGIYTLSQEATAKYEGVRDAVRKFINAERREEIIFTSGATESINLVAQTWARETLKKGDEILLTEMEHHSNIVPWQVIAKEKGAKLKYIPVREDRPLGRLDLRNLDTLITHRTKLVSIAHISNFLGAINPIEKIVKVAHRKGGKVLIDGAQAGGHIPLDARRLDCDFYVLSGHKMYGPTGVGILYGKKELLATMPPYQTGGHMIRRVDYEKAEWNELPWKFEAGTANIAEVVGLGAAVEFIESIGFKSITKHESRITEYCLKQLQRIPGIVIYGPGDTRDRIGVISFNVAGIPPHDLASILDEQGIAIRTGHHCAMPMHRKLGIESSARVSMGIYNTKKDVDRLIKGIKHAQSLFLPS